MSSSKPPGLRPGGRRDFAGSWTTIDRVGTGRSLATEEGTVSPTEHTGLPRFVRRTAWCSGAESRWPLRDSNLESVLEIGWDVRAPPEG